LAGFLTARLDDKNLLDSAIAGRRMAELKVATADKVERDLIYEELDGV